MKILVTGGAGFIGSHFVRFLLTQDINVINIDKLTYAGRIENLGIDFNHPLHFFIKDDICNAQQIQKHILEHKPQYIVHMAAESHVDRSIDGADDFIQTNIVGTHRLLEVSYKYYCTLDQTQKNLFRFIHLSTDEVFGALNDEGRFTEASPYKPNSPYSASKAASDLLVRSYFKTYGFPTIIVNSSNNYGPHQYPEKLIPLIILNAIEHKPLPVYGEGKPIRDWLYVEDHVHALWSVLQKGRVGEQYCIGSDNERNNLTLVKMICALLDKIKPSQTLASYQDLITFVQDRPGHDYRYAIDSTKLKAHTHWQPQTPFDHGLTRTVEWYLDNASKLTNFDARKRMGIR